MRISTQQIYSRGLGNMLEVNAKLQKTQEQISSGKRVLNASDDPVAAARILQLNQELELNKQFQSNIDLAQNRLELQDSILSSITDVLQRVRELTTQAGSGVLNSEDRRALSDELRQRLDQLAGMMNTKDASGEYLFAGFQGKNQPFVKGPSGQYVYQGDEGQRYIQIDKTVTVATTENGKSLFVEVPSAKTTFHTSANPGNGGTPPATISAGMVVDQEALDAIHPDRLVIQFNDHAEGNPPGPNFSVKLASSGKVLASNVRYESGQPILVAGIQFEIEGQPKVGDSFFADTSNKQGLLTSVEKLIYGVERAGDSPESRKMLASLLDDALVNIANAETSLLEARSRIGARMNLLDSTKNLHADVETASKGVLSQLQDLDYAEAVTRLSMESFILQAAQQTYTRVTGLSLFDQL